MLNTKIAPDNKTDILLNREWLLSNKRGGFACGTIANCNTRKYHSLLTGSLNPPASRIKSLACLKDTITCQGESYDLSNFEFSKLPIAQNAVICNSFYQDTGIHFNYKTPQADITKSIYLDTEIDRLAVVYEFRDVSCKFNITIKPFVAVNDFHSLLKSDAEFLLSTDKDELVITNNITDNCQLRMYSREMNFTSDGNWWYNFLYRIDKDRGQEHMEDLWSPGYYSYEVEGPDRIVLWASLAQDNHTEHLNSLDIDIFRDNIEIEQKNILKTCSKTTPIYKKLALAADRFIVKRKIFDAETTTILAGFPWFLDWGRDSFISLKGLLLETGRYEQAREVLCTFASAVDNGMIPNRFDDYDNQPHYNSIDASLWFINAAFDYLEITDDRPTFANILLPTIKWIIEAYYNGTKFGICADSDGLIMAGSKETQLTWMDAKCNGTAFTPRYGKAVEINALWHNAICNIADYYKQKDDKTQQVHHYSAMADEIEESFQKAFFNEHLNCLYDCVLPGNIKDNSIRPNQIFAVSLKYSPLNLTQQEQVVDTVEKYLLTDYGLRTLSYNDINYHSRYEGTMFERDRAYHQGTVWPWLIGPFIKAYLRVNNNSFSAKSKALEMLKPLLEHFQNSSCLGSINEIFDGDPPHKPRGCFAQAWSVASVIEAYNLLVN